ncbi:MAG: thiamine ABC transporter substrate-binding protein [Propionibacteriaceae bacterium]|jgi:thiamine transport system substrate-binding protein|nr:thiamine ABC transporter substrate-binding protein [Propionibacteriaceae bacterium]
MTANPFPARRLAVGWIWLSAALALTACAADQDGGRDAAALDHLTVISHDSFVLSDEAKARFEADSGLTVDYIAPGNAGTVVNQLVLTKDSPLADVVVGIDNTFAGRAIDQGVLEPYASPARPAGLDPALTIDGDWLTPVDYGDVCLNADQQWFAQHDLTQPRTLDDLTRPEYANLLVVTNPATSSPGLAFLAATVGAKGDPGYLDYWESLKANGLKVDSSWSDAYGVDFSGSSGQGAYPLVLSYASSPLYEVGDDGTSRTVALPQTCFRQVEYAGVISQASNPEGAQRFIDFLLSDAVQSEIPQTMYMSPVSPTAAVPADWAGLATLVTDPITVPAEVIAAQREDWIKAWTETVLG